MIRHILVAAGLTGLLALNGMGVAAAVSTGYLPLIGVLIAAYLAVAYALVRHNINVFLTYT